jgi:hypothetical protein
MLEVLTTSMPASRRISTSCQRFSRAEPGALVWASSSISATAGLRGEDRVGIHLLDDHAAILDASAGDDLETIQELRGFGSTVRLHVANDQVRPALQPAMTLLEHPVGFSHAGRHPEVDTQSPPVACGARPGEHLLGARTLVAFGPIARRH